MTALRRSILLAALAGAGILPAGCSATRQELSTGKRDPAIKIPWIKRSVQQRNLDAARQLVRDLDNPDPAVRFYAIGALRKMTGERYGYNFYQDYEERKPAMQRWQQWLAEQEHPHTASTRPVSEAQASRGKR